MSNRRTRDLTGNRYGLLVVLSQSVKVFRGKRQSVCHCRCDCGNEIDVPACALERKDGTPPKQPTVSCGCKRLIGDLTGQRFGRLTALHVSGKDEKRGILWTCRCDCGAIKQIAAYQLASGEIKSCGCALSEHKASFYKHSAKGVEKSHSPESEAKRAITRYGASGSEQRLKAADDLESRLTNSRIWVGRTNVASLTNTHAQGGNPYRGVCWSKNRGCWLAYCQVNGRRWCKSGFRTPEAAKLERDNMHQIMIDETGAQDAIDARKEYLKTMRTTK